MLKKSEKDKAGTLDHSADFLHLCESAANHVVAVSGDHVQTHMSDESFILIDVRDLFELEKQGYIDGAYHISKGWLEADIHGITTDKNKEIVLYCGSGKRSLLAAESLKKMGYHQVKSLQGGFKGWKGTGKPICTSWDN